MNEPSITEPDFISPGMDIDETHHTDTSSTTHWRLLGRVFPRTEVVFFSQTIILYIIIIVSLVNLTRGVSDTNLWASTLSGCLGYLMPNPKIKISKKEIAPIHQDI